MQIAKITLAIALYILNIAATLALLFFYAGGPDEVRMVAYIVIVNGVYALFSFTIVSSYLEHDAERYGYA